MVHYMNCYLLKLLCGCRLCSESLEAVPRNRGVSAVARKKPRACEGDAQISDTKLLRCSDNRHLSYITETSLGAHVRVSLFLYFLLCV